jgi:hypothetical protein
MDCIIDAVVAVISIIALWILNKASNAACESRDILKCIMKEYDENNDLLKR